MRLYHYFKYVISLLGLILVGVGCTSPQISPPKGDIRVEVFADGGSQSVLIPSGSTVDDALGGADVKLEGKDRVEPAPSSVLEAESTVRVIRVRETYETEEEVIPFQVIRQPSESLPEGEEQLLQAGKNGLRQVTHVRVIENGEEVSYQEVNSVVVREPVDEIVLVGMQSSVSPLTIEGRLVYLSDGNAWMMEGSTANRTLVVATGDLDGRVFSLSEDGSWLLFTRKEEDDEEVINSLWAAEVEGEDRELLDLEVQNVIHFGGWAPDSVDEVAYSTVESRVSSPGWQANNDLKLLHIAPDGSVGHETLVESIISVYGWWGTDFSYLPNGDQFVFASPDHIGIIERVPGNKKDILDLLPYKTRGDWAWMPGIGLGPNGNHLFTVEHVSLEGAGVAEESPLFNLVAVSLSGGRVMTLVREAGMFAYPLPSPTRSGPLGESDYQIAYLQAVFPRQSSTSKYHVAVMDRDGSNAKVIFPSPEVTGLEPSRNWGVWGPKRAEEEAPLSLAVLYQGNIHIVSLGTGESWPVTGDGRARRVDWK